MSDAWSFKRKRLLRHPKPRYEICKLVFFFLGVWLERNIRIFREVDWSRDVIWDNIRFNTFLLVVAFTAVCYYQ